MLFMPIILGVACYATMAVVADVCDDDGVSRLLGILGGRRFFCGGVPWE